MFLKCSTNNRASTVYELFTDAIGNYGVPSRVRSDQGGVAQFMLRYRGIQRNSMITGFSTHNQRIERLWNDVHRSVVKMFYRLFYFLEHHGLLNPLNEIHLFSLQYVYLPQINRALETFRDAWNSHGIRTMHNQTPHQLFVAGALRLRHSGLQAVDFFDRHQSLMIEDDNEGTTLTETVAVPRSQITLTPEQQQTLQQSVNPLVDSNNHGIELYEATVQLLDTIL